MLKSLFEEILCTSILLPGLKGWVQSLQYSDLEANAQIKASHELPNQQMSARVLALPHPRVCHPRIRVLVSHGWDGYRSQFWGPQVPVGCIYLTIFLFQFHIFDVEC